MPEFWCIDALPFKYMVIEEGIKKMKSYENV